MSTAVPRIGICGAGISGLTLAGILSRTLGSRVLVSVFERAPADRDQGYGLDLDQHGQEALARAGVYHRCWEISREFSDSMALYALRGSEPLGVLFRPAMLRRIFPSTAFLATALGHHASHSSEGALHFVCMDWRHAGELLAASRSIYSECKNLCV